MYLYVVSESFYFVNFCINGGGGESKIEVLAAVYIGPQYFFFFFFFFFLRQMYCYKILFVSCQHICIVIHILTIFFFFFL